MKTYTIRCLVVLVGIAGVISVAAAKPVFGGINLPDTARKAPLASEKMLVLSKRGDSSKTKAAASRVKKAVPPVQGYKPVKNAKPKSAQKDSIK